MANLTVFRCRQFFSGVLATEVEICALVFDDMKPLCDFDRYGNVELDKNHVVTEFCEKKYCEQGHINGGIYLLKRRGLLDAMPDKFSFESDFLQPQAKKGSVNGFVSDAYFIDIGVPADYERADREFVNFEAL
mgnify:CR=1 FL=1